MIFGYGRSRKKEELKEQRLQLSEAGCARIFVDDCSTKIIRTNFDKMVEQVRKGDSIVVPSVYVFPLTMIELVEFLNDLHFQEVRFKCLREKITDLSVFPYLHSYQKRSRSERAMANLEILGKYIIILKSFLYRFFYSHKRSSVHYQYYQYLFFQCRIS